MFHFTKFIVVVLFISSSLFAKVIESKKMSEILSEVRQDSVVVFDLDNTIMEAAQAVGSDQWFEHRMSQHQKLGLSLEAAIEVTVKEWEAVNDTAPVRLVEKETPAIIEALQDRGIPTMGLTARHSTFAGQSLRQLNRLGIRFDRRTLSQKTLQFIDKDRAIFEEGLMAVGGNNKGKMLINLLTAVGYKPGRVIFVDDKLKNVNNVDEALTQASIASFAFRYGAADETVKAFDSKLADFEFDYFQKNGRVLSDAEARRLMN